MITNELQGRRKILSRRLFHFVKFYLSVCINMCVCRDTRKKLINSWIKHNSSLSCRSPQKKWINFPSFLFHKFRWQDFFVLLEIYFADCELQVVEKFMEFYLRLAEFLWR